MIEFRIDKLFKIDVPVKNPEPCHFDEAGIFEQASKLIFLNLTTSKQ
ncbi:uncharacterized protein METZ01_LOCUS41077 [marine metagenome]|uniref:Uncharacterized protein n=1 Tax=marine metagenome TaxID=408172 RepID=A0A381RGA3_9ZZZZ